MLIDRLRKSHQLRHLIGVNRGYSHCQKLLLGITQHAAGFGVRVENFIPSRIKDEYRIIGGLEDSEETLLGQSNFFYRVPAPLGPVMRDALATVRANLRLELDLYACFNNNLDS